MAWCLPRKMQQSRWTTLQHRGCGGSLVRLAEAKCRWSIEDRDSKVSLLPPRRGGASTETRQIRGKGRNMAVEVAKIEIKSVMDASGLAELIEAGRFKADEVVAVVGKTEGNG